MIGQECIDELADMVGVSRMSPPSPSGPCAGEIEFEPALRERVALLRGLPRRRVDEVLDERIRLTPGARTLIAHAAGERRLYGLVSGGFTLFTRRIAALIGFDENRANTLVVDADGRLTGEVTEPILGREAKLATLMELSPGIRLWRPTTRWSPATAPTTSP